jgi:hypothetical protein
LDNGQTWSAPAALNTNAGSDGIDNDRDPFIITDGLGHWICAWDSNSQLGGTSGPERDIVYARSSDNGLTWSPPAPLNGDATVDLNTDADIRIATDRQGHWVAVWKTIDSLGGQIGSEGDILVARSSDNGVTWSYPVPLNANAFTDTGADLKPQIATNGTGVWIAVWHSLNPPGGSGMSDFDIFFSRSVDNGQTWTTQALLNSNGLSDSNRSDVDAQIATDGAGNWIVVWSSNDPLGNTIGSDSDILFSRGVNDGVSWTPAAALNTNAATDTGSDTNPQIVCDPVQHNWIVLWTSSDTLGGTIGSDLDILISRSGNNGNSWTAPALLNTNAATDAGADEFAQIATDHHGMFVSVWASRDSLGGTIGTEGDILRARFALPDCNSNFIPDSSEVDCNHNLVPDDCDIAAGTSVDGNHNNVPDECEVPLCPNDCAPPANGTVNIDDLLFVINHWGVAGGNGPADITGDGTVNIDDLLSVITHWGPC